jgi:hypothetical protein
MQIGLDVLVIDIQHLVIVFLLEESYFLEKQIVVARSSAEAEYRAMAFTTCELIWLKQLLDELKFCKIESMSLICDNQAALHIASNPVFHEQTKHIEIDCHFIREKILSRQIVTSFVTLMINWLIFSPSLSEVREYLIYVPSLMHMIYMHQLEGEC